MGKSDHAAMGKLRILLVDELTGKPAPNVPTEAWVTHRGVNDGRRRILGAVQTNALGYAAFAVPADTNIATIESLVVKPVGSEDSGVDVFPDWRAGGGTQVQVVRVPETQGLAVESRTLPAVQDPDLEDWEVSPASFATKPQGHYETCERLLPSTAPIDAYRFTQIVPQPSEHDEVLTEAAPPPCVAEPAPAPPLCVRRGALVEYQTRWTPLGHALGEIVYSLPLAPCESVKLAVIEWQRSDAVQRAESTDVDEQLLHDQRRDRTIDEVINGAISEWERGGAVMGAAAGTYSYGTGSLAASVGASYSTSAGDRNATADTLQRLGDAFAQSSRNARRLHSTVVVQASQREQDHLQTRTVTNNNHCHALTILYYGIVRHFLVETAVDLLQDVIMIRHPEQHFDRIRALRERNILTDTLLDRRLLPAFDALARTLSATPPPAPQRGGPVRRLVVKVTTGDRDPGAGGLAGQGLDRFDFLVLTSAGLILKWDLETHVNISASENGDVLYKPRQTNTFLITLASPVDIDSVAEIGLHYRRDVGSIMDLKGVEVLASIDGADISNQPELVTLYSNLDINKSFEDDGEWWARASVSRGTAPSSDRLADQRAVEELIEHLNWHREFYNRAVWLTEDTGRRANLLSRYRFSNDGVVGRLSDFVENRVVEVLGDYLVLPLGSDRIAETLVSPVDEPDRRLISLPARGAFAEAQLAKCNACEVVDDTRYWDWQESPCPCEAPEISGVAPGSRSRSTDAAPSLPAPNLGIQEPGSAPDPSGVAAMLELLGRSEVFRDMSGRPELAAVMTSVVNGAVQLSQEQMRQQTERQRVQQQGELERHRIQAGLRQSAAAGNGTAAVQPAADATGGTSRSGSRTPGGSPVRERDRAYRSAQNAIDRSWQAGDVTDSERQELSRSLTEAHVLDTVQDPLARDYDYTLLGGPETTSTRRVRYQEGEANASLVSPGEVTFRGTLERVLYDFGVNEPSAAPTLKPAHERFLSDMIGELGLASPSPRAQIELIEGYTDLVDTEATNANLRSRRAEAVASWLTAHGVAARLIGRVAPAPAGYLLTDNRTPEARAGNRAVLIRISPIRVVQLPPERLQPADHRSTQWEIACLMNVSLGELIQGTLALCQLTDRSLPDRPKREILFGGGGFGAGGTIPGTELPRLPGARPGVGLEFGGTPFHTTVPLRFEDFELAIGSMWVAQVGFMLGYGAAYTQISGQRGGRRWAAISDDPGVGGGTTFIWIGGFGTTNIGGDVGGYAGVWTFTP